MKENVYNLLQVLVFLVAMIMGFWLIFMYVWYAVGLPLTNWSMWLLLAIAGLTEYGYFRWTVR